MATQFSPDYIYIQTHLCGLIERGIYQKGAFINYVDKNRGGRGSVESPLVHSSVEGDKIGYNSVYVVVECPRKGSSE